MRGSIRYAASVRVNFDCVPAFVFGPGRLGFAPRAVITGWWRGGRGYPPSDVILAQVAISPPAQPLLSISATYSAQRASFSRPSVRR